MATSRLKAIKHGIVAIGVCASLAAGSFGFVSGAEARVSSSDTGELAMDCALIQWRYDLNKSGAQKATDAREKAKFEAQMQAARVDWLLAGCDDHYGSIASLEVQPGVIKNTEAIGTVGELSPETNPQTSKVAGGYFASQSLQPAD